jgi:hypothetical protein
VPSYLDALITLGTSGTGLRRACSEPPAYLWTDELDPLQCSAHCRLPLGATKGQKVVVASHRERRTTLMFDEGSGSGLGIDSDLTQATSSSDQWKSGLRSRRQGSSSDDAR